MYSNRKRVHFPIPYFEQEHEKRGINDGEIRFKGFSEKQYGALGRLDYSFESDIGGLR